MGDQVAIEGRFRERPTVPSSGRQCHRGVRSSEWTFIRQLDWAASHLRHKGYVVHAEIVDEEPEKLIAERVASENIDLLVMGAYGHSRIRNLFVGSTTTEMIRSCKVPILLYR